MRTASTLALAPSTVAPAVTVAGLLLTLLLAALDSTIVATAMPSIANELNGLDRYSWVAAAYLLTSTVSVPVVGKLVDQYGRRVFLLGGTLLFAVASTLCALAGTLDYLIAFRVLQGVGAGAITAAVFAAVPELFAPAARARLIGLFTGTYGLASIIGPLLGGVLTDVFGWRGVFWINLPIALLALSLVVVSYPRNASSGTRGPIDYFGAAALMSGMTPLLIAFLVAGRAVSWTSTPVISLLLLGAAFLVVFALIERRVAEPVIPLRLVGSRALGMPVFGSALMNAGLFAMVLFTPLFAQGVIGQTATNSGGVLVPMTAAWVLASILAGQLVARIGKARPVAVAGMVVATGGLWLMALMDIRTDPVVLARNVIIVGSGLGAAVSAFVLAGQNAVPDEQAGVATSLTTFARAIGATVASAALGGLLISGADGSSPDDPVALSVAISRIFVVATMIVGAGTVAALRLQDPSESIAPRGPR
jgi:EmrB/QacA subfamily drug resistance transporter